MNKSNIVPTVRDARETGAGVCNIDSIEELKQSIGQEVAISAWFRISQDRIRQFADATEDRQWIHLDTERSRRESPFGDTVAHGFLTLSLLPMFMEQIVSFPGSRLSVNYGLNRVRFPAPVPAGSRIRARLAALSVEQFAGSDQVVWQATLEREGGDKPVCVAELIARYYR